MNKELNEKRKQLKELTESYIKQKADEIELSISEERGFTTLATCDHYNWDRKLHFHFPKIADELRSRGYSVSNTVNWGVTDWVIKIRL